MCMKLGYRSLEHRTHTVSHPIPGIPAVIIFKMQREKSKSRWLFLDGRNIFIFALVCARHLALIKKTLKKKNQEKNNTPLLPGAFPDDLS